MPEPIVTSIGCQKEIARKVLAKGGQYVLALKENQPNLAADVALLFQDLHQSRPGTSRADHAQSTEKGHGRIEIRDCWIIADPVALAPLRGARGGLSSTA